MSDKKFDEDEDLIVDENYTVINMNVDGMKGYLNPTQEKNAKEIRKMELTKKEKRALFWGSFLAMLPMLAVILVGFAIAILFSYWWLA